MQVEVVCEESVVLEARASQFAIPETKEMDAPSLETIARELGIDFQVIIDLAFYK